MSIQDKIVEIKKILNLVCEVVPLLVQVVRDTISLFKTV